MSVFGRTQLYLGLSLLDFASLGSQIALRSFARLGGGTGSPRRRDLAFRCKLNILGAQARSLQGDREKQKTNIFKK